MYFGDLATNATEKVCSGGCKIQYIVCHDSNVEISEFFTHQGVGPTAQRAAVVAGVELPVYDWCKKKILDYQIMGDNPYTHFWYKNCFCLFV